MASLQLVKHGFSSTPPSSSTPPKLIPLPAPTPTPNPNPNPNPKKPLDPNMSNPRLLVNRPCIYERKLPGGAYITAHVQRLQHGYYSSEMMSDIDAEHVDFLAISFIFHSSNTQTHRFKSATIRASVRGKHEVVATPPHHGDPSANPRFLMHAPHLIFGTVSPETMQWTFSLAGSLGISEGPASASVIPSGSVNKQYRRYEMMRIQGSSRTRKSAKGPKYDVEAGEVFWSLEENNLQRSGLPREFTFVMLVQKPTADSNINLTLDIEPVLQARIGNYPSALLSCSSYQPLRRPGVNFRREVGQKFEPRDPQRGFNFAALESSIDDYIAMPGRKFTRSVEIPPETQMPQMPQTNMPQGYPGQYGGQYGSGQYTYGQYNTLNPVQQMQREGFSFQDNITGNLLQSQLRQLQTGGQGGSTAATMATSDNITRAANVRPDESNTLNVRVIVEGLGEPRSPAAKPPPPAAKPQAFSRFFQGQAAPQAKGPSQDMESPREGVRYVPSWHRGPLNFYGLPADYKSPEREDSSLSAATELTTFDGSIGLFSTDRDSSGQSELADGWVGQNRPTSTTRARELGGKVYAESEEEALWRRECRARARKALVLAVGDLPSLRRTNHFERLNRGPLGRVMLMENLALTPELLPTHSSTEAAGEADD